MSEAWFAPVEAEVVWFSGGDALRFLNDLISQEIGDMGDGEARRSFLLEPQGKLRFLFWVIRDGERYGLVTEEGRGEELASALGRYRIRVDVDIALEEAFVVVGGDPTGTRVYDISWVGVPRRLVVGERPDLPPGSVDEYEGLRIGAGEPRWDVDVDEGTIPHESGLVPVSVDFDKGCFLGQELVARIESRGANPPRNLRVLRAAGELTAGQAVTMEGEEMGIVSSASGSTGLAMLKRAVSVGDTVEVGGVAALVDDPAPKTAG